MAKDAERLGRLPGEVKVNMAVDMTNSCLRICAEGIKAQHSGIMEKDLIEKMRERISACIVCGDQESFFKDQQSVEFMDSHWKTKDKIIA